MFVHVFVLVCLFSLGVVALGQALKEGETCKETAEGTWTCKATQDCPTATNVRLDGNSDCGLNGTDMMVCCVSQSNYSAGIKSNEMCKKYAEYVFLRLPDLFDGGYTKYDTCGVGKNISRTKRIVDGQESKSREYPHMALIGFEAGNGTAWLCGGSLISDQFVLTSAYCAKYKRGPARVVRLGDFNIQSDSDEDTRVAQPTEYGVIDVIIHPDFKRPSVYNDIGLLKLNTTVMFTEFIRPICLHTRHEVPSKHCLVAGWGRTGYGGKESDTLQTVNLTIFSQEKCFDIYKAENGHGKLPHGISEETMICAGDPTGVKNTCKGDSGNPLQVPLKEPYCMYSQVGVTSFGVRCAAEYPTVFTRVSHYLPWIENIVWP